MSNLPRIIWQDTFSVGVAKLDEHHRHLAELINRLADSGAGNVHAEQVVDAISDLVLYGMYHFAHEERLMEAHGFPGLPAHRAEHDRFCEVISETSYGATLGIIDMARLVDYLMQWWENHILFEDMQFKPLFAASGVK